MEDQHGGSSRIPFILQLFFKIHGSSLMPSSHNCFDCENSFHPSGAFQESFPFDSSKPIISELFIPAFSYHSANITGASFKYSLISSRSLRSHVSKIPSSIFIRFPILPGKLAFATFFFNSRGGSFKISLPSLSYQFIRFFNPTGGSMKTFPSLRNIYLNPFYENKEYAKIRCLSSIYIGEGYA